RRWGCEFQAPFAHGGWSTAALGFVADSLRDSFQHLCQLPGIIRLWDSRSTFFRTRIKVRRQRAARMNYLGIEIGGTKLQLVAGDEKAVQARHRFDVERSKAGAGIREQITLALPELVSNFNPAAIGVGFGGPVDWKTGRICRSHQIEGWSEFALGEWLQGLTGKPVRVDNDANMAALGESMRGAGTGFNPVFYVTLGSGVGGGLVVDGRVYHGAAPGEAEIGHVRLDRSGAIVESRCSGWAVDAKIRALKQLEPSSLLCRLAGQTVGGE